jgi:hypothetical protein
MCCICELHLYECMLIMLCIICLFKQLEILTEMKSRLHIKISKFTTENTGQHGLQCFKVSKHFIKYAGVKHHIFYICTCASMYSRQDEIYFLQSTTKLQQFNRIISNSTSGNWFRNSFKLQTNITYFIIICK